jgi:hypothetical protein
VETQVSIVDQIRDLEARADAAEDEAIRCKYEAARLITEELERREGGARQLAEEIGKSHTHVLRMEHVWRKHVHGLVPKARSIAEWNKLYKGPKASFGAAWPKPKPSVVIRTPEGLLEQAVLATRWAVHARRLHDHAWRIGVARKLIKVLGEDIVRQVLREAKNGRRAAARRKAAS